MQNLTEIKKVAASFGLDWRNVAAFLEVETGGHGFNEATGKIIIQFEPAWFKKQTQFAPNGLWSENKVDVQSKEWEAFNNAFSINPKAAMMSTSIGLGQVMGFHYRRLGYATVDAMWDDAKSGIERQIWQVCKFICADAKLQNCLKCADWNGVATLYNGAGYKALAIKLNRTPYDISLREANLKYSKLP